MYEMLRNMEPPVGFGKKCPYRLAYRVTMELWDGKMISVLSDLQGKIRKSLDLNSKAFDTRSNIV